MGHIETKYHEHVKTERPPSGERMARYEEVTERSGAFKPSWKQLIGTELQQIWLDFPEPPRR